MTELLPLPLDSGGKIKTLNTLQSLSKRYQVYLVCFSPTPANTKYLTQLKKIVEEVKCFVIPGLELGPKDKILNTLKKYAQLKPYLCDQFSSGEAKSYVNQLVKKVNPKFIHCDHLSMAQYLPSKKKSQWIYEEHNIEHLLAWQRFLHEGGWKTKLLLLGEYLLVWWFEIKSLRKFDAIFSITKKDQQVIQKIVDEQKTKIFLYRPVVHISRLLKKTTDQLSLLFIGDLTWIPNQDGLEWFLKQVWPLVSKKHFDLKLNVVGKDNPHLIKKYHHLSNVKFWGYQNKLDEFLTSATIFINPFRISAGIKIKLLTALSHQVPIVSTSRGLEGMEKNNGWALKANKPKKFTQQINKLLNNNKLRQKMTQAGVKYLGKFHDPSQNNHFLENYQSLD